MTYEEMHPILRAYLGTYSGFRHLGFSADDVYLSIARSARFGGRLSAFALLKTQGKEFNVELGPMKAKDVAKVQEQYNRMAKGEVMSEADGDRIWQESEAFQNAVDFIMAIQLKGIVPPLAVS